MQFTDLLVGVLTEFPESPDGCHSDRLREAKRSTTADYETQNGANRRLSGRVTRAALKQDPAPLTNAYVTVGCLHTTAEIATTHPS